MKTPEISESAQNKLIKAGLVLGFLFLADRAFGRAAKNAADKNLDTDPAAGQARGLDAAMNPSGIRWLRAVDSVTTAAIYQIASQITNLDKVREYYHAQHNNNRDLNDDLTSKIGADGYMKFLSLATKGKTGDTRLTTILKPIPVNLWVVTKREANVRKSPKIMPKYIPHNNIVMLVEPGKAIGSTTGKYVYNERDNTTFIEFYTLGVKQPGKHFFYVAKSQVELLTDAEKKKREKKEKIPLQILAGLGGISQDPQTQAVSEYPTMLYDEQFKALSTVPANVILGYPVMTLNTGKGEYVKVQTVQGNLRWVQARDVRIENRL